MPHNVWKKAGQLLGVNAIVALISLIIILCLSGLVDASWYRVSIDALCAVILLILLWGTLSEMGLRDLTSDELEKKRTERLGREPVMGVPVHYRPANGFIIGAVAQAPFMLMSLLLIIPAVRGSLVLPALNAWFIMFSELNTIVSETMGVQWWLYLAYALAVAAVSGMAYRSGLTKKRRIRTIIERNVKKLRSGQRKQPAHPAKPPKKG